MLTTIVDRVGSHADRILLSDSAGEFSGDDLTLAAFRVAEQLIGHTPDAPGFRVGLLARPGFAFVSGMLGGWSLGAMVVPLCPEHPPAEMDYVLRDADVHAVLVDPRIAHLLPATDAPRIALPWSPEHAAPCIPTLPARTVGDGTPALMLYTSGTTGRPKGVVHSHGTMNAQIRCLLEAWEWNASDRIPHFLPLHHVHGLVNKLLCPLWVGARCDIFERFDAATVFGAIADANHRTDRDGNAPYSIFMAVPTVYAKAITAFDAADRDTQHRWSQAFRSMRVMISGSAALPLPVLERWRKISGHTLLERYGMTEIGIALGNPLHGIRRAGFVGHPLPGMSVRVVDDGRVIEGDGSGELQARGANVFVGYWNRPEETASSFTEDGWFRTGDQVAVEDGAYRISGRLSTDIIKSGGYKISALEIESVLTGHPDIAECCVVGLPDDTWGERVGAAVVLRAAATLDLDALRDWARPHLAPYKLPTVLQIVPTLPRNVMGKVVKPEARELFPPRP